MIDNTMKNYCGVKFACRAESPAEQRQCGNPKTGEIYFHKSIIEKHEYYVAWNPGSIRKEEVNRNELREIYKTSFNIF